MRILLFVFTELINIILGAIPPFFPELLFLILNSEYNFINLVFYFDDIFRAYKI